MSTEHDGPIPHVYLTYWPSPDKACTPRASGESLPAGARHPWPLPQAAGRKASGQGSLANLSLQQGIKPCMQAHACHTQDDCWSISAPQNINGVQTLPSIATIQFWLPWLRQNSQNSQISFSVCCRKRIPCPQPSPHPTNRAGISDKSCFKRIPSTRRLHSIRNSLAEPAELQPYRPAVFIIDHYSGHSRWNPVSTPAQERSALPCGDLWPQEWQGCRPAPACHAPQRPAAPYCCAPSA